MKKLLILLLALFLTGCGASAPAAEDAVCQETTEQQETAEQTEEAAVPQAPPREEELAAFVVELTEVSGKVDAEDGAPLVEYAFRTPVLRSTGADEAAAAEAETFNARFAEWHTEDSVQELATLAEDDLAFYREMDMEWRGAHFYDLACTVYRTERLISVAGTYAVYTGGAHPNTFLLSWNFDLKTGEFLGAEEMLGREELTAAVTEELVRQARERAESEGFAPEEFFWEDYETILADWPSYAVSFDAEGMSVAFSPYELAAYAAGAQHFHVDYALMRPYLDAEDLDLLGLQAE